MGVPGKLYLSGIGLSPGYLNVNSDDQKIFFNNEHIDHAYSKMFLTNDLCRWLPSGEIEYIRRAGTQVQIRGHRVELSEIEAVLLENEVVSQAVVCESASESGSQLLAYITVKRSMSFQCDELLHSLKKLLPDYMIPSVITPVDFFPLTQNGKINVALLPKPIYHQTKKTDRKLTAVEKKIHALWQTVLSHLGSEVISVDDHFFALGGSSLSVIKLMLVLNDTFHVALMPIDLMKHQTIKSQAQLIFQKLKEKDSGARALIAFKENPHALPIFLIPSRGAGSESYHEFYPLFPDHCALYCLESYNLYSKNVLIESMSDLAEYYVSVLEKFFPKGPYIIGGWSFGGNVAYAMAQILQRKNKKVAFIFMLDSLVLTKEEIKITKKLESLINRLFKKRNQEINLNVKMRNHLLRVRKIEGKISDDYVHEPLPVDILVFKATQYSYPSEANSDEKNKINFLYEAIKSKVYNGWDSLTQSVEVVNIDAMHLQMIKNPYAIKIVEALMQKTQQLHFNDGVSLQNE
jgi:thioesterase domain-containing protein/acyl carrier protein